MSEKEPDYELLMPFVTVQSKGGPHEDEAYTAGWEMGALDARLTYELPAVLELTIQTVNVPQADLLAMKHGYVGVTGETDADGWSYLNLTRADAV